MSDEATYIFRCVSISSSCLVTHSVSPSVRHSVPSPMYVPYVCPVCIQNHLRVFRTITKSCKPYQTLTKPLPNPYQTHTKPVPNPYQILPNPNLPLPNPYQTLQTVPNLIKYYHTKHLPNLHQTLFNPTKPLPNL